MWGVCIYYRWWYRTVVLFLLYRIITTEAGRRLAEQWKAVFVEASAKQNEVCGLFLVSLVGFHCISSRFLSFHLI